MGKKVAELESNPLRKRGEDPHCSTHAQNLRQPQRGRVRHDQAWRYSLASKTFPLKPGVQV